MFFISESFKAIANDLEIDYKRFTSLKEANSLVHYDKLYRPVLMYIGSGKITQFFEGAQPLQSVITTFYMLSKKDTTDATAEAIDLQKVELRKLTSQTLYKFPTVRDIVSYELDSEQIFDDMLIGYKCTVTLTLEGNAC